MCCRVWLKQEGTPKQNKSSWKKKKVTWEEMWCGVVKRYLKRHFDVVDPVQRPFTQDDNLQEVKIKRDQKKTKKK